MDNNPYPLKSYLHEEEGNRQYDLLISGVNPYPRLAMEESRRLIQLMRPFISCPVEQQLECQRLQRKACGLDESEEVE